MIKHDGCNFLCRKADFSSCQWPESLLGVGPGHGCFHQQVVLMNSSLSCIYNVAGKPIPEELET